MKINITKDNFHEIECAFSNIKELKKSGSNSIELQNKATDIIGKTLEDGLGLDITINIVTPNQYSPLFVMAVYPETSTTDKIISELMSNNENKDSVIKKLWEQNKAWTIEIDERIFDDKIINITPSELTALLLHEIGHVIYANSITTRICTILQYEIASTSMSNKALIKDRFFKRILSLPIFNACIADSKNDDKSLKNEIKADKFAKKMGYTNDLYSVMNKLIHSKYYPKTNADKNMSSVSQFSISTIDQLKNRQTNLMKKNLLSIIESCDSPYIKSVVQDYYNLFFEEMDSYVPDKKLNFMLERANNIANDNLYQEFSIFGSTKLKRIDPSSIDYINVKIETIKSESDKMMLISYINYKLDIIDYYISILENPKLSRKYSVPHTIEQLQDMKTRLNTLRDRVLNYKIPERLKGIIVAYPENYEG